MSLTERPSILRRNPYADRRSFVARAMGLSPIGDIASGGMTDSTATTTTLTWETATDWDNSADEAGVVHESFGDLPGDGVISKGYPSFDRGGSSLAGYYPLDEDSGSATADVSGTFSDATITGTGVSLGQTGVNNTTAFEFANSTGDYVNTGANIVNQDAVSLSFWIKPTQSSSNYLIGQSPTSSNYDFNTQINNGELRLLVGGSGYSDFFSTTSLNTGTWYHAGFTNDPNGQAKIFVDGVKENSISGQSWSQSSANVVIGNIRVGSGLVPDAVLEEVRWYRRALSDDEMSALADAGTSGYLESATKSFASSATPDLQNLDYTLNGETVDLKVIGSPDTASEEVVTQTLDGASSYSLSWSNTHTDFRVRPEFTSSTPTVSSTVNRIGIVG